MAVPTERARAFGKELADAARRLVASATHVAQAPDATPLVYACSGHQYGCATPL